MKKIIQTLFCTFLLNGLIIAQNKVETVDLMGKTYTVTKVIPPEIVGTYRYEGEGDPKVLINDDGSGYFQPHQTAPINIKIWVDCDENGKWRKQVGGTGRYQYTLVIQYLDGNNNNYKAGSYDLLGVMVQPDMSRVSILGERYKPL